jgi:hypothetical protein
MAFHSVAITKHDTNGVLNLHTLTYSKHTFSNAWTIILQLRNAKKPKTKQTFFTSATTTKGPALFFSVADNEPPQNLLFRGISDEFSADVVRSPSWNDNGYRRYHRSESVQSSPTPVKPRPGQMDKNILPIANVDSSQSYPVGDTGYQQILSNTADRSRRKYSSRQAGSVSQSTFPEHLQSWFQSELTNCSP